MISCHNSSPTRSGAGRRLCVALGLFASFGCASRTLQTPIIEVLPPEKPAHRVDSVFAPGARLLEGFDDPATDAAWRVGDRVLWGIQTRRPGQTDEINYVLLTVRTGPLRETQKVIIGAPPPPAQRERGAIYLLHPDPSKSVDRTKRFSGALLKLVFPLRSPNGEQHTVEFQSQPVLMSIEVYDAQLERISVSHALAPELNLRRGLFALTDGLRALRQRLGPEVGAVIVRDPEAFTVPFDDLADLIGTLFALRDTIWSTPSLWPVLQSTVKPPSILSMIANVGIRFSMKLQYAEVAEDQRELPGMRGGRRAVLLPFNVLINDEPMVRVLLSIAESKPPLQPCAGIIGVDAQHPEDPERTIRFRILAARRGAAPVAQ